MDTRITNIGQLVTPRSIGSATRGELPVAILRGVELHLHDGRIAAIDGSSAPTRHAASIDARGGVVLPALCDPHTHYPVDVDMPGSKARQEATQEVRRARLRRRLRRALAAGVTTVEVKCRSLGELDDLASWIRADDRDLPRIVPTLFGATMPGTGHGEQMADLIGNAIPTARRHRWARFCDVSCGDGAYPPEEARTILRAARAGGLQLQLHAAGSDIGGLGAIAVELGVTAVGHLDHLRGDDAAVWRDLGIVPVLLPGESLLRGEAYPEARRLMEAGLAPGLGTNAGGAPIAAGSMWLVIATAIGGLGLTVDEAVAAVTLHNAHALELAAEIGSVEVGKRADLVILDLEDYRELLSGLGENPVRAVIRDGELVAGG